PSAQPGQLVVDGEAHTEVAALGPGGRLLFAEPVVVEALEHGVEAGAVGAGVVHQPGGRPVGDLFGGDQVDPADGHRVEAEPAGGVVEEPLHDVDGGRAGHPPVGPGRGGVGGDAGHVAAVVLHPV